MDECGGLNGVICFPRAQVQNSINNTTPNFYPKWSIFSNSFNVKQCFCKFHEDHASLIFNVILPEGTHKNAPEKVRAAIHIGLLKGLYVGLLVSVLVMVMDT
ncbi:uncharacterized protein EAF01_003213 [Botrytis porri]|uniref:uncharacterized protein n=1 Tax=Botrytis porri TaxID=87229 RepID=UPI001901B3E9|nr:uncharacterized protein EAF01_003213 [Botrytis porri]KAF7909495.1 hypothetical protein EAF01_003213 [Botrytis porri]